MNTWDDGKQPLNDVSSQKTFRREKLMKTFPKAPRVLVKCICHTAYFLKKTKVRSARFKNLLNLKPEGDGVFSPKAVAGHKILGQLD